MPTCMTKIRQAHKFLSGGDRVKFSVKFRGREMTHPEIGRAILDRVVQGLADVAQLERPSLLEGRFLSIQLVALPRQKGQTAPAPGTDEPAVPALEGE